MSETRRPFRRRLVATAAVVVLVVGAVVGYQAIAAGEEQDGSWSLAFSDEFGGDSLDTRVWNTCHWWDDDGCTIDSNDELEWYLPEQVTVGDGRLRLTATEQRVEGSDGRTYPYRSGMVTTGPPEYDGAARFTFTYGRVEARVRAPAGRGLWSAIWLLPEDEDSRPEIDVLELLGNDPQEWIFHFHPDDRSRESDGVRVDGPNLSTGWHDIAVDWEPGRIRWFIDGDEAWTVEGDHVPDEPMYLVANLAVGGVYPGEPDDETGFPATFEIESIKVWQRSS